MSKKISGLESKRVFKDGKLAVQLRFFNVDLTNSEDNHTDVIIYRQETDNLCFNDLYTDSFGDGAIPTKDDIIFKGKIPPRSNVSEFYDYQVQAGSTYIYWVGKKEPGVLISAPIPVKVRHPDVWWSYERVCNEIKCIKSDFPEVEVIYCGETVGHKPLEAVVAGNRENIIACTGAVHAGESGPEISLMMLRNILETAPQLLKKTGLAILPSANPDSREKIVNGLPWYIRKNANEVDLNRNFDFLWENLATGYGLLSDEEKSATYKGMYPNSEPETRALINYISLIKPKAHFSYHWLGSICSDRLAHATVAEQDAEHVKILKKVACEYSKAFRKELGEAENELYNHPESESGSFPAYLYSKGIIAYDVEMAMELEESFGNPKCDLATPQDLLKCTNAHTAAMKAMLRYFAE